jgi:hypothetical protein
MAEKKSLAVTRVRRDAERAASALSAASLWRNQSEPTDNSTYTGQCSSVIAPDHVETAIILFSFEIGHTLQAGPPDYATLAARRR